MLRRDFLAKLGLAVPATIVASEVMSFPQEGGMTLVRRQRIANEYDAGTIPITWHFKSDGQVLGTWAAQCLEKGQSKAVIPFYVRCVIREDDGPDLALCEKEGALRDALQIISEFERTSLRWEEIKWVAYSPKPDSLRKQWLKEITTRTQNRNAAKGSIVAGMEKQWKEKRWKGCD